MLNVVEHGTDAGAGHGPQGAGGGGETPPPPLLIAHGLFGSARNWNALARRLGADRKVLAVDMRNHGHSPRFPGQSYEEMADDLAEVIRHHGGTADVLGHSMGGKAAMMLALRHPELVRRLIVADIAPVAYSHSHSGLIRAMRALDPQRLSSRAEADALLAARLPDPALRAFLLQSLDLKEGRWRLNLDTLEREMDSLVGFPDVRGRFDGPALFLSGSNSDYLRAEHRPRILELFPAARFEQIEGAGHWLHAEKPREFEAALHRFLEAPIPGADGRTSGAG